MYIAWGPRFTQFYNDGYRPILGTTKHPAAMGSVTSETFAESWHIIGPMFEQVMRGIAVGSDDWMLPLDRHGFLEECYFCYSYSPIRDESDEVGGVLVTVTETTARVLAERRMATRQALARLPDLTDGQAIYARAMQTLASNSADIPFASIYVCEPDTRVARRVAATSIGPEDTAPDPDLQRAIGAVARSSEPQTVVSPGGAVVLLPLKDSSFGSASAVLALGRSPRLHYDQLYRAFFEALADDIARPLANLRSANEAKTDLVERATVAVHELVKLRDVFEQAPAGIAVLSGPHHRYEVANEIYRAITNRDDIVGKTYLEAFPELIGTALPGIIDHVYATGEAFVAHEYQVFLDVHRDGALEERFFRFHLAPVRDVAGLITGLLAVAVDVTDQVVARRQAELAQTQLAFALDTAQLGPWDLDLVAGTATRSIRHDQIFGYSAPVPDWSFDVFLKHVRADHRGRVAEAFERARTGEADWIFEAPIDAADGTQRWIAVHGRTVKDSAGVPIRMLGLVADISERKQAEEHRHVLLGREQAARADAEAANRAKDEFLAMLGHELRTPLNAITGWARMLREGSVPEAKWPHAIEVIDRNANAQAQLIDDLLDVSRIISGKVRIETKTISPAAPVEAAIDSVRPAAEAKGVRLQIAIDQNVEMILGDPDRLQQVVWNLVNNAIKFTPRGGRVLVGLRRQGAHVLITVDDDGQGIKPEFMPYMFERFRQADATLTRALGGLGLGLAIARHLIELHGGSISAHSDGEGKGASFVVSLPIIPMQSTTLMPGTPELQRRSTAPARLLEGLHVLVVDDEADARDMLSSMFEHAKARVSVARTADEARAVLRSERPDVVVCDIGMPGEDGFSFIRGVRASTVEHGSKVAAVALTAFARPVDRTQALTAGFDLHLAKPVDPAELVVVVANLAMRGSR